MKFNIAEHNKAEGERNREMIAAYFVQNPYANIRECARAIGMNETIVGKHVRILKERALSKGD